FSSQSTATAMNERESRRTFIHSTPNAITESDQDALSQKFVRHLSRLNIKPLLFSNPQKLFVQWLDLSRRDAVDPGLPQRIHSKLISNRILKRSHQKPKIRRLLDITK